MHEAVLQLSKSCFEFKKLSVAVLGTAVAVLLKFTDDGLDHSLFVVGLSICGSFWLADATNYYYQRVVRREIDKTMNRIGERSGGEDFKPKDPTRVSRRAAAFNPSMTLHFALSALLVVGWIAYGAGLIST